MYCCYHTLHTITLLLVSSIQPLILSSNLVFAASFHSSEFFPPSAARALLRYRCTTGPRMVSAGPTLHEIHRAADPHPRAHPPSQRRKPARLETCGLPPYPHGSDHPRSALAPHAARAGPAPHGFAGRRATAPTTKRRALMRSQDFSASGPCSRKVMVVRCEGLSP